LALAGLAVASTLAVAGCVMRTPPADLDLARSRSAEAGRYVVTVAPASDPIPLGSMHAWTVEIRTPDGQPVEAAKIVVDGGMPQHGHGLPSQPAVTRYLGDGLYALEGMKFTMPGWWVLEFDVEGKSGRDGVTFNLML
jgi:hypothetical protein